SASICACLFSSLYRYCHHCDLSSLPTRRSSDLGIALLVLTWASVAILSPLKLAPDMFWKFASPQEFWSFWFVPACLIAPPLEELDRKSTRLNSSHVKSSYAAFCLKKKKYTPRVI